MGGVDVGDVEVVMGEGFGGVGVEVEGVEYFVGC